MRRILVPLLLCALLAHSARSLECLESRECAERWPDAFCRQGRCVCSGNSIRRKSDSRGWVCLSIVDASTGMLGPPVSCPIPEGAGFRMILRNGTTTVFCDSRVVRSCPVGYECIRSIGIVTPEGDGVCCPNQRLTCEARTEPDEDGWIPRWRFDGSECTPFMWNPQKSRSMNVFRTKEQCYSYCISN
uniref:BPTI/Kunitz inhibitor domain-containing protein n=1 Tax=Steinernema glaseri TaxID=37863 RepID=A0A1I7ZCS2_9BILA